MSVNNPFDFSLDSSTFNNPFEASSGHVSDYSKYTGEVHNATPGKRLPSSRVPYTHAPEYNGERLFQILPRYANDASSYDRGDRCRLFLLSNNQTNSKARPVTDTGAKNALASTFPDLFSDPQTPKEGGYTDFILTDIQAQFNEKVQVSEVFGDNEVVYYFGKQPVMFTLSGILIDDVNNNWFHKFIETYTNVLRGSELARNGELVQINLPMLMLQGSISNLSISQNSANDVQIPFTMTVIVKKIQGIPGVPFGQPITNDAMSAKDLLNQNPLNIPLDQQAINNVKKSMATLTHGFLPGAPSGAMFDSLLGATGGGLGGFLGGGLGGMFDSFIGQANSWTQGIIGDINSMWSSIGISAGFQTGFRGSLFSPVYGFLFSITKVIQALTFDMTSIFNAFANPINSILRDINSISRQALGVVGLIESSVSRLVGLPFNLVGEIKATLAGLKNTVGVITRAPETIVQSMARLSSGARLNSAHLNAGTASGPNKMAILRTLPLYTPLLGATI